MVHNQYPQLFTMNENSTYVIGRDGKWLANAGRWVTSIQKARRFVGLDRATMRCSWCKNAQVVEVDEALKGEQMCQPFRNHERKVNP
jgi:hypothetical protein